MAAARTKQTANQARAAAAAFEQAYAMTVPPSVVVANRIQLKSLIATNFFGQNTAAIAAAEAQYAEMWAQDAAAMYDYAANSSAATRLPPFSPPEQTTNPAGESTQNAAVNQAAATSAGTAQTTLPQLSSLASQVLQAPQAWPNILPDDFTILDGLFGMYATIGVTQDVESVVSGIIGAENNLGLVGAATENAAELAPDPLGISSVLSGTTSGGGGAGLPSAVTVSTGRAGSIGPMSVPASWAAPSTRTVSAMSGSGLTTLPGTDGADAADHGMPGVPGMPAGSVRRASSVVPRYGVRLTVMPRPPAAG
jgi:PPE-repeat protein